MTMRFAGLLPALILACSLTPAISQAPGARGPAAGPDPGYMAQAMQARLVGAGEPGSSLAAAIGVLKKPAHLPDEGEVTLEAAVEMIWAATRADLPGGLPIFIDPIGLREAGNTPSSRVAVGGADRPLGDRLATLAGSLGMVGYVQRDGVVVLTSAGRARGNLERATARNGGRYLAPIVEAPEPMPTRLIPPKARPTWARLAQPVSLPFQAETPLADFCRYLNTAVPGLTIRPAAAAPRGAGKPAGAMVSVSLDGVPLRTGLALALAPLDLTYEVGNDGTVRLIPLAPRGDRR